jgi:hypothetical protein
MGLLFKLHDAIIDVSPILEGDAEQVPAVFGKRTLNKEVLTCFFY